MAMRFLFALTMFASVFGFNPSARAAIGRGCEECPIPMSEWLGTWWSDDSGLMLQINRLSGMNRHLKVVLRDIFTNKVVANGIGVLPTQGDVMTMKLRRQDGVTFTTSFEMDLENDRVLVTLPKWIGRSLNGKDVPPELFFYD